MPTIPQSELPKPKSWDEFEDIVWDLYIRLWQDPHADRYGRSGQRQHGVDIVGRPANLGGRCAGIQCKRYAEGTLTEKKLAPEIDEAAKFLPPLAEYTIATTDARDASLQSFVLKLSTQRQAEGKFPVYIVFWETLCGHLTHPDNRDLLQKHYGDWLHLVLTSPTAPYQAPRSLGEFVGRTKEIQRLTSVLTPSSKTAITGVVGMGGLGKTELAKKAAIQVSDRFRDGVFWADCGQQTITTIADLWANAWGVQLPGDDAATKAAAWRGLVSSREALLIFDNVQPDQEIEPLFPPKGQSTVLLTTRHTGHPALRGAELLALDQFRHDDATALIEKVLGSETVSEQLDAATLLFELVGYLPLALSVAVHLAKESGWSLNHFNGKLEAAGALAVLGDEDNLRTSLNATFETAWENLPGELQDTFRALALFNHGPSFSTQALAETLNVEIPEALARLRRLVGRSLVLMEGEGRWALHPLLREFAATRPKIDELTQIRMAQYYVGVARTAEILYLQGGEDTLRGLTLFDLEWPHIQAVQAWVCGERGQIELASGEAARLCSNLAGVAIACLSLRLDDPDLTAWLTRAIQASQQVGDSKAEGTHLGNLGNVYAHQGLIEEAIGCHEQALIVAQESGDRRFEGTCLGNLGNAYYQMGDIQRAIEFQEQALGIAREVGDKRGEGNHQGSLGVAYIALGEFSCAAKHHTEHLHIAQEIGDRRGEAYALGNLGLTYANMTELDTAMEFYQKALAIAQEIGDRRSEGNGLRNIAKCLVIKGTPLQAVHFYEQALVIAHETYDLVSECGILLDLGHACASIRFDHRAIKHYEQALTIAREMGNRRSERDSLWGLGNSYASLRNVQRAIEFYEESLVITREIEDQSGEGRILIRIGHINQQQGDTARARELWTKALHILESIDDPNAEQARRRLTDLNSDEA